MHYTKLFHRLLLLVGLCLWGCESESKLTFQDPQPLDKANENQFAKRFQGQYINSDGVQLTITDQTVIRSVRDTLLMAKAELDTIPELRLQADKRYSPDFEEPLPTKSRGDSVEIYLLSIDSLFTITSGQVLRYDLGNYFLNYQHENGSWRTQRLSLDKRRQLAFSEMVDSVDIPTLRQVASVTEVKDEEAEVIAYSASPSKKELRKFLRRGGFSSSETYRRIETNHTSR